MNIDEKEEKNGEMAGTSQDGPGLGAADSRSPGQGAAIGTGSGVPGQNAGAGSCTADSLRTESRDGREPRGMPR